MKHILAVVLGFLSLFQPFPAKAAPADAAALRAAHEAYFGGFPDDRAAVLALGQEGNVFAAMMLERTWQRDSFGPVSASQAAHWSGIARGAGVMIRLAALAAQGDAAAMTWLGTIHGAALLGVESDPAQSALWYEKGAERGDANAQRLIADMYRVGDGVAKDASRAAFWYRKAAEQGQADAQAQLGVAYWTGSGVVKDGREGASWSRRAAEQGHATAEYNLGIAYSSGNGVPKDASQAAYWFRKAAEQGNARAQYDIGLAYWNGDGVRRDQNQAVVWFRKAAEQGNARAQYYLGAAYWAGNGVPKDYGQARSWFLKAAEQGQAVAQYNLAGIYRDGLGVPKDVAEALSWYRKSAEQGYANAQNAMGFYYVEIDEAQSASWFRKAAEQGHALGQYNLGSSYWEGRGVPTDLAQATYWFQKAADQGHAISQFNLGIAYDSGAGVPRDTERASVWYRRAAAQGHPLAQARLAARSGTAASEGPEDDGSSGFFRSLIGATVGATMMAAAGADSEQVLGGAMKGAQIFNPDSAATAALGGIGDSVLGASSSSPMAGAGLAHGTTGYPARSNLASGACPGFTEANYRERALSGGGDQQLYAMCGQAFEYYTMYKRAIAQGYSEADANRTYAAHEQAARVANGYLHSHGAN